MTRPLLSVHMPLHRAVEFDYPYIEALQSVLPIADEVHVVVHPSGDGTEEQLGKLAWEHRPKIHLHEWEWWQPARKEKCLADATNYGIEQCAGVWHLALQADEVVHESQLEALLALCRQDEYPWVEFERLNLYGTFDGYNTNRGRWPCSVVRLAKRDLYPHICSYDDATHLGIPKGYDERETPRLDARGQVALWHYSYTRTGRAFVERQASMARLYGLNPDPVVEAHRAEERVDWWKTVPRAEFAPLPSEHPQVMREWVEARRERVHAGAWE